MSLMSAIRELFGRRREATAEFAEYAGAPDSYLAFGGRRPRMPTEPARVETANSVIAPRPIDPGEVIHIKRHPHHEEPPTED
jgi:hypothetical protein